MTKVMVTIQSPDEPPTLEAVIERYRLGPDDIDRDFGVVEIDPVDGAAQRATYTRLRQLARERPDVTIVPTHCPEAADALLAEGAAAWRQRP